MPIRMAANLGGTPTAVVDSGMPIILASTSIANGIYGALGVGPSSDGNCTCLLNFTPYSKSLTSPILSIRLIADPGYAIFYPYRLSTLHDPNQHDSYSGRPYRDLSTSS